MIFVLVYMFLTYPSHYTREEIICASIGNLEKYYEFLKYENFKAYNEATIYNDPKEISKARKNKNFILQSFQNLKENMHAYNNSCKEFNLNEEKIIDDLFDKVVSGIK